jgi:hypothetical protein
LKVTILIWRTSRMLCGILLLCLVAACGSAPLPLSSAVADHPPAAEYGVVYRAQFLPERGVAIAEIEIRQRQHLLRELAFAAPRARYRPIGADGRLTETERGFVWVPPRGGGVLRYEFTVERQRGDREPQAYDALMTREWALLRADQLFPPARTRTARGARSRPSLELTGPDEWSFETRYGSVEETLEIEELERGFVRPTGWMIAGRLGIRREEIADRQIAVAAPVGQGFRRLDTLAMLNWNLPYLVEVFPEFPQRLLIVGAGDPMWRGGLSGPASLYLHADRPMLSENGTSTLIHELVHVGSRFASVGLDNWIVEGIAEYYSVELMRRSGTITDHRFELALEMLERWGATAPTLRGKRANGPMRAAAAVLLHHLNREIEQATGGEHNLDEVMRRLQPFRRQLSLEVLLEVTAAVLGAPSVVLAEAFDRA